jgi:hypothetical protein
VDLVVTQVIVVFQALADIRVIVEFRVSVVILVIPDAAGTVDIQEILVTVDIKA